MHKDTVLFKIDLIFFQLF